MKGKTVSKRPRFIVLPGGKKAPAPLPPNAVAEEHKPVECLAVGCSRVVPAAAFCCPRHWDLLSRAVQNRLLDRVGLADDDALLTEAQIVILKREGKILQAALLIEELRSIQGEGE